MSSWPSGCTAELGFKATIISLARNAVPNLAEVVNMCSMTIKNSTRSTSWCHCLHDTLMDTNHTLIPQYNNYISELHGYCDDCTFKNLRPTFNGTGKSSKCHARSNDTTDVCLSLSYWWYDKSFSVLSTSVTRFSFPSSQRQAVCGLMKFIICSNADMNSLKIVSLKTSQACTHLNYNLKSVINRRKGRTLSGRIEHLKQVKPEAIWRSQCGRAWS